MSTTRPSRTPPRRDGRHEASELSRRRARGARGVRADCRSPSDHSTRSARSQPRTIPHEQSLVHVVQGAWTCRLRAARRGPTRAFDRPSASQSRPEAVIWIAGSAVHAPPARTSASGRLPSRSSPKVGLAEAAPSFRRPLPSALDRRPQHRPSRAVRASAAVHLNGRSGQGRIISSAGVGRRGRRCNGDRASYAGAEQA